MENDNKQQTTKQDLKAILGDAYSPELETSIKAFIGQGFVAKSDFAKKNEQLKDFKQKLAERAEKTKDTSDWSTKIKTLEEKHANELKTWQDKFNNYRLDDYLAKEKAKNPKALRALLDSSKIVFEDEDIKGLKEQLDGLKKSDSYLFDLPADNVKKGAGFPANAEQKTETVKTTPKVI